MGIFADKKRLGIVFAAICGVAIIVVAVYFLKKMLEAEVEPPKKVVQEVRIIRPPRPPRM